MMKSKRCPDEVVRLRFVVYWIAFLLSLFISTCFSQSTGLPEKLGRLRITDRLEGAEAKSFLDRLHDKEIAPKNSVLGHYRDGNDNASVYISTYASQSSAADASRQMTRLISTGNRVFTQYKQLSKEKPTVGRCEGLGQTHFFFRQRNQVYWLSADPSVSEETFQALLGFLEKAGGPS